MLSPDELKRWQQGKMRELMLETLDNIDWEGKTQREMLDMVRTVVYEYLHSLYDWVSTMFSRFLRTVTTEDPVTGKRVRAMLRDSAGRYWRRETVLKDPVLFADCLKQRDQWNEADVEARNALAADAERMMGALQPRARIVYEQLPLGLFPRRATDSTPAKD